MSRIVVVCIALLVALNPSGSFAAECLVRVTAAYNAVPSKEPRSKEVQLGDVIELRVDNLADLYQKEECKGESTGEPVLFLAGLPLKDHVAKPASDPGGEVIYFTLERTKDALETWATLLAEPTLNTREIKVSVGYPDRFAVKADNVTLNLRAIPGRWLFFWGIILVVMGGAFLWLAGKSNVLRADPIDLGPDQPAARGPYSLARVQAAWWFFLIVSAYLFIGMITGDFLSSFNGTALALLGMGAAGVIGSAIIDASKPGEGNSEDALTKARKDLADAIAAKNDLTAAEADKATAESDLATATAANDEAAATAAKAAVETAQARIDAASAAPARIESIRKQLAALQQPSQNLLMDIITDANGVVFHRFQSAAWTLVLGIIFILEVYKHLSMPVFDNTLLGLMGVSLATYLGLKIPEPDVPSSNQ